MRRSIKAGAVSPRSPRSEQHSRRHTFSKSPPLPKHSASKASADNFEKFLLEDVSLSNIAGPIFDISGGSERGSLSSKDEKNLLDWSPGLSKELSQLKVSKVVEKIEKEEEPKSAPITEDTSISTEIGEPPIDRSVEYNIKEIERFCHEIWPQVEASMQSGDFDSMIPPVINSEDSEKHYHDAYR
uniref:Uncharacterized protein n=1 Tax=Panagrolaimus sp. PS1159 TaxID=55785 RepID=A0AC35FX63_9BILA